MHKTNTEPYTINLAKYVSPYLTIDSCVAVRTGALVCPITVHTTASIETWFGVTLIDIILTVAAGKSRQTQAGEGIDSIHTGATIETRAKETQENEYVKTLLFSF